MRDPLLEFQSYNRMYAQRNPELVRLKVTRMSAGPFAFFRGSFHLFARDVLDKSWELPLPASGGVEMDLMGDIHSENYGTYKAADGKIHYDINDFDETTRGRFDLDVCRLATSLYLAARERGDSWHDAVSVPMAGLTTYTEAVRRFLKKGADYDVSEKAGCDCPVIDDMVRLAAATKRSEYIPRITEFRDGRRQVTRSLSFFNLPDEERAQALRLMEDYVRRMPPPSTPDFYAVEDICGRVAGVGSMGRLRYAVLVTGKGSKDGRNILLEFKEARPSAIDVYRNAATVPLAGRAEQIVAVQRLSQAACSSHVGFAIDGDMSFTVREIGPHDNRIDVKALKNSVKLERVAQVQAAILARTHARAAHRTVGVANPLAELNDEDSFCQTVLAFALAYADRVRRDWTLFMGQRSYLASCEQWAKG